MKISIFLIFVFCLLNITIYTKLSENGSPSNIWKMKIAFGPETTHADIGSTYMDFISKVPFLGDVANFSYKTAEKSGGAGLIGNIFLTGIKWLLYGVFVLISWFLGLAAVLFGWVVDTKNIDFVLKNSALYESWKMVRDFLNLAFILVLLFSAFCTIFQVEKYHLKKILLTLVIMALLVNFSFPISRFIIDVSNVIMYFLLNGLIPNTGGDGIFAQIADYSAIAKILTPENIGDADVSYLLAIIIFTFILMITLLVIAVMFVIRLVFLGILIIFSPIGFVAAIFPSTKHYADDWWGNLFKYSFFAPIMVFMIVIAIKMLSVMKENNIDASFLVTAGKNVQSGSTGDASFIANMAFFAIPIVILWAGLITAQKMSIAGADVVTGKAKQFAGWAGRQPWRGTKALVGSTGVSGGVKQAYDYYRKKGIPIKGRRFFGTEQKEEREAKMGGFLTKGKAGWDAAGRNIKRKRVAEKLDEIKKFKVSKSEAVRNLDSKDETERIAHALYLSQQGLIDNEHEYDKTTRAVSTDPELIKEIESKIKKENRVDILVNHDITYGGKPVNVVHEDRLGQLAPDELRNQKNLLKTIDTNANLQNYVLDKIAPDVEYHQELFKRMDKDSRTKFTSVGLNP